MSCGCMGNYLINLLVEFSLFCFQDFLDDVKLRKMMEDPKKNATEIKQLYLDMYHDLLADTQEQSQELYENTQVMTKETSCVNKPSTCNFLPYNPF